jgi:hypothetical protein
MGYTSYLRRPKKLNSAKFKLFVKDVQKFLETPLHGTSKVYEQATCFIMGGNGEGSPVVNNDLVCFNGERGKFQDFSHETFAVERVFEPYEGQRAENGKYFTFCKTAQKPYDILVCMCLISLEYHFGDAVEVSSDGDLYDWEDAIALYEKITNREVNLKMFQIAVNQ